MSCDDKIQNLGALQNNVSSCLETRYLGHINRGGGGGGGGETYYTFLKISCFYHSENMYWVTLNVKINFKEFLTPHNPPVHTP